MLIDRRLLLRYGAWVSCAGLVPPLATSGGEGAVEQADYSLRIATGLIELAPEHIVSTTLYNGQFPGPLLRFKEGQQAIIDVHNDTDTPELVHWHGQIIPSEVDGAAEEGTPYVPAHGMQRITFVPKPAGFRLYHTHVAAGGALNRGTYTGQVGPVYVEPKNDPGAYDREVFLVMKEFEPTFTRKGEMAMNVLPDAPIRALQQMASSGDNETSGKAKGCRSQLSAVRGQRKDAWARRTHSRKAGRTRAIPCPQCQRNGDPQPLLAGSRLQDCRLDGNAVPRPADVPFLWLGTAERVSAVVEMNNPGAWVMGDLADDDRRRGMGIVIEYAGFGGEPQWAKPEPFRWDYTLFGKPNTAPPAADEMIEVTIAKRNGVLDGFDQWALNGEAFSIDTMKPMYTVHEAFNYPQLLTPRVRQTQCLRGGTVHAT